MKPEEVLKEEYVALRNEICQSIAKQHQITLAGYGLASAATGYIIAASEWKAFVVIPLLLTGMIALWAVECNRMVRASYYIGYVLWPELCTLVGRGATDGWETWIRLRDGNEGIFRRWQNQLQQIVVILVPFVLSVSALVIAVLDARPEPVFFWSILCFGITLFIAWFKLYSIIRKISDLAATIPDFGPKAQEPNK